MRVTQMMLANNSLSYINQGYNRLGKLQDQLNTGKKITRPSQDPVVAMKGMRYRTQVTEVEQFKRNLGEAYSWMDTAESALDQATETLKRIRELAQDAANDSKTASERANIAKEIEQLREHIQSIANTKNSNKYIFNGTNTTNPPVLDAAKMNMGLDSLFKDDGSGDLVDEINSLELVYAGSIFKYDADASNADADGNHVFKDTSKSNTFLTISSDGKTITYTTPNSEDPNQTIEKNIRTNDVIVASSEAVSFNTQTVEVELFKGVTITVNIDPGKVFNNTLFGDITRLENALKDPEVEGKDLSEYIDTIFGHIDVVVAERAELGARINRAEMMENRLLDHEIIAKKIMSDNEDVDLEEVFINLTIQESIHRAALAAGARILQPTLMDFLR